jgi:hypothetical protein
MTALNDGCALAEVTAFADAHSPNTGLICHAQAPWLPAGLPACKT